MEMDDMIMEKIDIKKMDDNGLRFSCGNVFPHCRFSLLGGVVVLIAEHVLFPFHGGVENPVLGSFLCFLCLVVKVCPRNFNTMIIGPHFFIPLKSQWIKVNNSPKENT